MPPALVEEMRALGLVAVAEAGAEVAWAVRAAGAYVTVVAVLTILATATILWRCSPAAELLKDAALHSAHIQHLCDARCGGAVCHSVPARDPQALRQHAAHAPARQQHWAGYCCPPHGTARQLQVLHVGA